MSVSVRTFQKSSGDKKLCIKIVYVINSERDITISECIKK